MRRRQLLASMATGVLAATAGCGYAYGGGDLREEGSVGTMGFGATRYLLTDGRIVGARSGRIVDHERGGFHDGTSVTVSDLDGTDRWRYNHGERVSAVVGGGPVYLLDEQGRVVALTESPPPEDEADVSTRPYGGEELWRVGIDGAEPPLASDDRGAYVAADDTVVAVRDGEEVWRAAVPSPVQSLHVAREAILATTLDTVVALSASGRERWRRTTGGAPALAVDGDRVAVQHGHNVTVTGVESDEGSWTVDGLRRAGRPTVADGRVFVVDREALRVFDAETGDRLWRIDTPDTITTPVVSAPEGAYAVGDQCRATALDEDGVRWTRELSVRDCDLVGGWLNSERVAFLFESGEIRWLQRTDQDVGLL